MRNILITSEFIEKTLKVKYFLRKNTPICPLDIFPLPGERIIKPSPGRGGQGRGKPCIQPFI
jgi:hypothetical protein